MSSTPEFDQQIREALFLLAPEDAEELWNIGQGLKSLEERASFYTVVLSDLQSIAEGGQAQGLKEAAQYKWAPVDITTFICDPYYLDKAGTLYPKVLEELIEMNDPRYQEIVLTGGIGSAKTTCALYTTAYQLYLLSCMVSPHAAFQLDSSSEILFVFQSINKKIAEASFRRFKDMVEQSRYFNEKFAFDQNIQSKLVFPNRIEVVPISGQETGAIGQNVIGGFIDELNYMGTVEKSKQSVDGGTYDQAVALYNSIARRRKSRFLSGGKMPGKLCLVSSKRYPGQFTDTKEEEAKRDPTIYIYDYRVWEIKPAGSYSGKMFEVFIGDQTRKPRIMRPGEAVAEKDLALVDRIPVEYREEFEKDIINALREIAGRSTLARHPFMVDVERVYAGFGAHQNVFSQDEVDFVETQLALILDNIKHREFPRYAHIDLAISGDSAGVALGCVPRFVNMKEAGFSVSDAEFMPYIHVDGVLRVKPPKNGEILFYKVRDILLKLRANGVDIRWVSFDSFQSTDSMQLLRQQAFLVGDVSMDTSIVPYETLKQAFYTGRVGLPMHKHLLKELVSLEFNPKTAKVDHPPKGSKDVADALAGVAYGLTMRREIWGMHRINVLSLPSSIGSTPTGAEAMREQRDQMAERVARIDRSNHEKGVIIAH